MMTRRTVLHLLPLAALASRAAPAVMGKLAPRCPKSIASSPLGIGFETLDRSMFDPAKRCFRPPRWTPADLLPEVTATEASLLLWSGPAAFATDPVLIDPLAATVRRLNTAERQGGFWRLESVPVRDYSLLITGLKAIQEA